MSICYHHNLVPTAWNQPKPEPAEMIGCECGQNMGCPVCGWGWGTYPCRCSPDVITEYQRRKTIPLRDFIQDLTDSA